MKNLTPKAKQKLFGLTYIFIGLLFSQIIMPDECGWGWITSIIGVLLVLAKKQYLDFD